MADVLHNAWQNVPLLILAKDGETFKLCTTLYNAQYLIILSVS